MKIRQTGLGSVIACEHEYTQFIHGKRKSLGTCQEKFISCSVPSVVVKQALAAGWERVRFTGGIQLFCPDHTRKAIADRERAKRERNTERLWK